MKQGDNLIEWQSGLLYLALGFVICVFAAAEHFQWLRVGLSAEALEWTALLILACIVGIVIVLDRRGIEKYIDDALGTSSDLMRSRPAGIRYKPEERQRQEKSVVVASPAARRSAPSETPD